MPRLAWLLISSLFVCRFTLADFASERDANWHQWRGPLATGVAPTGNPPLEWSETRNVKWKVEIPGRGSSTPIIWGERVFLLTSIDTKSAAPGAEALAEIAQNPFGIKRPRTIFRFVVICLDRNTGKTVWERNVFEGLPDEGHHLDNSFASSSPTTDGQNLYAWFGSKGVYCFDFDGQQKWHHPMSPVQTRYSFGEACSPVVHGDFLVLNRDNETQSAIEVLDTRTGIVRWRATRDEVSAWATPLVVESNNRPQLITNASKRVRSYDLATGKLIWECGGQVSNVIPSPMRFQDTVLCLSGYRGSSAYSIPLASVGDVTDHPSIRWKHVKDTPYVPSAILYDDRIYFNKTTTGIVTCLNAANGRPFYEAKRVPNLLNVYASPVGANGRIYYVAREGNAVLLKHNTEAIEILAQNKLDDGFDASPAIVGNQLFLRGRKYLYCLQEN